MLLLWRDPALRVLFTTDMAEQQVRFALKLTEIVRAMPRLDELLAHTLGDDFDARTREAWGAAYNLMAETMLEGAASARPIGLPRRTVPAERARFGSPFRRNSGDLAGQRHPAGRAPCRSGVDEFEVPG
jgi:hypothetical protein